MRLLTINSGSSSLKAALFQTDPEEVRLLRVSITRIGLPGSQVTAADGDGALLLDQQSDLPSHEAALRALFDWLGTSSGLQVFGCSGVQGEKGLLSPEHLNTRTPEHQERLDAVGHRMVLGEQGHDAPQLVTDALLADLKALQSRDPEHMPAGVAGIETVRALFPALRQVVCFDTAFHRRMPTVAALYALPRTLTDAGIVRLGFHGLSYEYVLDELRRLDPMAARGRVIVAHLGNGASMAAIRKGTGVDTSMGFTPLAGLVMGTRCGDLDPGVLLHLLRAQGMTPAALDELLHRHSGLLGVSGTSSDMRDLLAREASDRRAAEAVQLFCYRAKQYVGAYAAVLGGLDTLVFTGGIGENAPAVRERICAGLEFLGLQIDLQRNAANDAVVSRDGSPVRVRMIRTDEERMIARHTHRLLRSQGVPNAHL
jgi:acetate kinase